MCAGLMDRKPRNGTITRIRNHKAGGRSVSRCEKPSIADAFGGVLPASVHDLTPPCANFRRHCNPTRSMAMKARTGEAREGDGGRALSPLKREFDQWRAARRVGERIPPRLWDAAVSATARARRVPRGARVEPGLCGAQAASRPGHRAMRRPSAEAAFRGAAGRAGGCRCRHR